ncbi:hypothetical protein Hypma_001090 [Hypsizygus marmoreus]|uniref:DUF202 domain-containing protein n=1 Tax=Hypsizygus marmoreus TaxID=39966 RepID=A0A369JG16_HYPMA|nr:hypothetical protein Hypma_001090 [Hypsizygus marmoreus]
MSHRYRGHRANSFEPLDINELVEIRARQRTFHGAYSRTALSNLASSLTILRLFDQRFYRIGLLFSILGSLLFVLAAIRSRHSRHDFADPHHEEHERVVIKTVAVTSEYLSSHHYIAWQCGFSVKMYFLQNLQCTSLSQSLTPRP